MHSGAQGPPYRCSIRKIETLGSGRHKVPFRLAGKQTSETFDRYSEAESFAKWLDALGPQGALDKLFEGEQQSGVPTLDEIAEQWIRLRPNTTDGTRLNYRRLWARTWGPIIGGLSANRVTEDDVAMAVITLGRTYSRKSLENQRGLLSGVVGRAVKQGHLVENIAKGMPLPAGTHGAQAEMRILTPEEFDTVIGRVPPAYRTFVRFLYASGARWGEAVVLQNQDVRLPNVHIRRALKWSPDNDRVVGPPKTSKGNRAIAITDELHDELRGLTQGRAGTDLTFTAPRGGEIRHRTFWSRVWLPAVSHLEPRPRIHDLRHSHASLLLARGIPIHVVQRRLGHSSIQITVDTYGHLLPDAQMLAANASSMAFVPRAPELD